MDDIWGWTLGSDAGRKWSLKTQFTLQKSRDFLLFTWTIQKTAESAEARREKQHLSAVNLFCHDSFIQNKLKSHQKR